MTIKLRFSILLIFWLLAPTFAEETWNAFRLPFGHSDTRYDFVKVPLHAVVDTYSNQERNSEDMYADLAQANIILIGESHTSAEHHSVQERIIQGLAQSGKPVIIGLEMFTPNQNRALNAFSQNLIDENAFVHESEFYQTWGHNYFYYEPIFKLARDYRIPMFGVNIPKKRLEELRNAGYQGSRDAWGPNDPQPSVNSVEHRYFIQAMMQGISVQSSGMFEKIYFSQCLWDAAMAENLAGLAYKFPRATIVCLVGSGHVAYGLGIARVVRERTKLAVATVMPVDVPIVEKEKVKESSFSRHLPKGMKVEDRPFQVVSRGLADVLIGVPEQKNDKYPSTPVPLKEKDGKLTIGMVFPDSFSDKLGVKFGDQLLSINNISFMQKTDALIYLSKMRWGDTVRVKVRRNGKTLAKQRILRPEKQKKV